MKNSEEPQSEPAPVHYGQLQPAYYRNFHCLADQCPDTCCEGWRVGIDKQTYDKYQASTDPLLRPAFHQFVNINPARTSDDQYAAFETHSGCCSFLSEGLCSIQKRLGETYLSAACASFPRVTSLVSGMLERSIDLSCPEAARLAVLDPAPLQFLRMQIDPAQQHNVAQPGFNRIASGGFSEMPANDHVSEIRQFVQLLLQNRKYPVSKRLILLGHVCDKLGEIATAAKHEDTHTVLAGFSHAIASGLFDEDLNRCSADPATQLRIILEFLAERIKSDFTHRLFLQLYNQFLEGVHWTPDMTLQELGKHFAAAHAQYYAPLMSQHEYVLEHYLVNNAFKTLFPFGSQNFNRVLKLHTPQGAITAHYLLLASYFSIVKTMLIGVAGYEGQAFNLHHVVHTMQVCSKTFEHSLSFPQRILDILAANGIASPAGMTVLTQN